MAQSGTTCHQERKEYGKVGVTSLKVVVHVVRKVVLNLLLVKATYQGLTSNVHYKNIMRNNRTLNMHHIVCFLLRVANKCCSSYHRAMKFLKDCSILKIEDILPFFPDFVTIDHFKVMRLSSILYMTFDLGYIHMYAALFIVNEPLIACMCVR